MIRLFFAVIAAEMWVILLLLLDIPSRDQVVMDLNQVHRGRRPLVIRTVAGAFSAMLLSSVYSMMKIHQRSVEEGALSPTDQVLMNRHLLQSTLIGASLFFALLISRLHPYIREYRLQVKVQRENFILAWKEEVSTLERKLNELQGKLDTNRKAITTADINAVALRKQTEGFLIEYNRLHQENTKLRTQLQSLDLRTSRSPCKKNL